MSDNKRIYYIEWKNGCTLVSTNSRDKAQSFANKEFGFHNAPYQVRLATASDIAWVKSFGGIIHV